MERLQCVQWKGLNGSTNKRKQKGDKREKENGEQVKIKEEGWEKKMKKRGVNGWEEVSGGSVIRRGSKLGLVGKGERKEEEGGKRRGGAATPV